MTWPHEDESDMFVDGGVHDELSRTNAGRIRPGEIRNPAGRPIGSRDRGKIIRKIALTKHTITENGRRRKYTAVEIVLLTIRNNAAKGDLKAMDMLDGLQLRFSHRDIVPPRAVFICGEKLSEEGLVEELARIKVERDLRDEEEERARASPLSTP